MTNEELNTALYEKMYAEQEQFRAELLDKTPEGILSHAYEYSVREDIVECMGALDLSDKQAKALLKLKNPLSEVYKAWTNRETLYMDHIRDTIGFSANAEIRADYIRSRREER